MIISLIACIWFILSQLNLSPTEAFNQLSAHNYTRFINVDPNSKTFFLKTILGGMFITIAMTGLDQEMMQKNISVDNLQNSKKNMLTFAGTLLIVNLAFLFLGGILYLYAIDNGGFYDLVQSAFYLKPGGENVMGDDLFPALSLQGYFPIFISVIFIIGLISALFPSADGALTAVTSSFCVDLLKLNDRNDLNEKEKRI